jgi:hypothetical protein
MPAHLQAVDCRVVKKVGYFLPSGPMIPAFRYDDTSLSMLLLQLILILTLSIKQNLMRLSYIEPSHKRHDE